MRHLLATAAAGALTLAAIAAAHAHATLENREAAPGGYKAVIRIPHGCDGQPTNAVRVELPEGYINAKPQPKAGWDLAIETGDYAQAYKLHGREIISGAKIVTWSGGSLPDEYYDEFVLSGTLSGVEAGQSLFFKTVQTCADGEVAWEAIPAAGQDPHSLDHPAPGLTILAASGGHGAHGHGDHAGHDQASHDQAGHDHAGHDQADGASATLGDLAIASGWARAMLPGQKAGGGYLTVTNNGAEADRLIGASSPAAGKVEIHTMEVVDDVMTMRPVEGGLEIPAGGSVELKPGGYHIMFMGVGEPFADGSTTPVTLRFEKAGEVELALPVRLVRGSGHDHDGHDHDH